MTEYIYIYLTPCVIDKKKLETKLVHSCSQSKKSDYRNKEIDVSLTSFTTQILISALILKQRKFYLNLITFLLKFKKNIFAALAREYFKESWARLWLNCLMEKCFCKTAPFTPGLFKRQGSINYFEHISIMPSFFSILSARLVSNPASLIPHFMS